METSALQAEFARRLEISPFGIASESLCRVYASVKRTDLAGDLQLAGTLTGPFCRYADTLGATYAFADRGATASLFAEALVPEPCFWTPQMPHWYSAVLELREGGRVVARTERLFGMRRLTTRPHRFLSDGKNWVLRAVAADELPAAELAEWHDAETAMCVRNPSDALCDAASRVGVLVVAELGKADVGELARLRRWPAVGIVVVAANAELDLPAGGVVRAQRLPARQPPVPAAWARAAIVDVSAGEPQDSHFAEWRLPVIAIRPAGQSPSVADGRRQCDRLQADLAPLGQFAGYIV
jgi:hypothetical protein